MKDTTNTNTTQILGFIGTFIIVPIVCYIVSIQLSCNFGWMAVTYFLFISHVLAIDFGSWLTTRDNRDVIQYALKSIETQQKASRQTPSQAPTVAVENALDNQDLRLFSK
jgi:hypothetical protein